MIPQQAIASLVGLENLKEQNTSHMTHNPTPELRCLVAHFEWARGGSLERQKPTQQPLECSGGAVGGAQALELLELFVVVKEASIDFFNSLDMSKIPFVPSAYTLQEYALEWA